MTVGLPGAVCEDAHMPAVEVLVVEDAPEYAQIVTTVARENGYSVRTASTLADARVAVDAITPDLVVLDLTLPDGDGLDLCRTLHDTTRAYVLVLTGRDEEIDKVLGKPCCAFDDVEMSQRDRIEGARV